MEVSPKLILPETGDLYIQSMHFISKSTLLLNIPPALRCLPVLPTCVSTLCFLDERKADKLHHQSVSRKANVPLHVRWLLPLLVNPQLDKQRCVPVEWETCRVHLRTTLDFWDGANPISESHITSPAWMVVFLSSGMFTQLMSSLHFKVYPESKGPMSPFKIPSGSLWLCLQTLTLYIKNL